jgi:hypothetical protein
VAAGIGVHGTPYDSALQPTGGAGGASRLKNFLFNPDKVVLRANSGFPPEFFVETTPLKRITY